MVEEPLKMKKKDQISFDKQEARRLQAELDQEQRLEQKLAEEEAQKALKANIAVIEQWHDVQAKIEVDFELAQRLHQEEQEQLTDAEKGKSQQRSLVCTYLKNMDGWKPKALKIKSFAEIQELFDKAMTRINNFVDFRTKLVEESSKKAEESSSKRAVEELEQENTKKQKVDDDQEETELKKCLEIIPDGEDDVTIDATPLSSMSPTIIDYNIHKERRKSYFQIIRTDGSSQLYYTFSKMHKNFNREDLEVL
uniref:Uncharacterized protein n=1 Tax=Tanacetum cinerariifolium TaxID=118510 RepID=A0A699HYQ1_TANCI|nr:hypothetical protein [Tanacetum cinerariifolium]